MSKQTFLDVIRNGKKKNLRSADLRGANLWDANLRGANLWDADLRGANLWDANLRGANLWDADLRGANLWDADLRDADLRVADLRVADLRGADLRDADLRGANLLYFNGGVHTAFYTTVDRMLRIGCEYHSLSHWLIHFHKIGELHHYSENEIARYGAFIKTLEAIR